MNCSGLDRTGAGSTGVMKVGVNVGLGFGVNVAVGETGEMVAVGVNVAGSTVTAGGKMNFQTDGPIARQLNNITAAPPAKSIHRSVGCFCKLPFGPSFSIGVIGFDCDCLSRCSLSRAIRMASALFRASCSLLASAAMLRSDRSMRGWL